MGRKGRTLYSGSMSSSISLPVRVRTLGGGVSGVRYVLGGGG